MKTCTCCKIEKEYEMFSKLSRNKDGRAYHCRSCTKKWREDNKEAILAQKKEYYHNNIEIMRGRNLTRYAKFKNNQKAHTEAYYSRPENWVKKMLTRARYRAEECGWDFNLSAEDIVFPTHCPYLGLKLTYTLGQGQLPTNASIDRIDPLKGYTKDNVQIISRKANTMKSNASMEELISFSKYVLKRIKNDSPSWGYPRSLC